MLLVFMLLLLVQLDKILKSQTFFLHPVMFEKHICFLHMLLVCMFNSLKFVLLIPISVVIL